MDKNELIQKFIDWHNKPIASKKITEKNIVGIQAYLVPFVKCDGELVIQFIAKTGNVSQDRLNFAELLYQQKLTNYYLEVDKYEKEREMAKLDGTISSPWRPLRPSRPLRPEEKDSVAWVNVASELRDGICHSFVAVNKSNSNEKYSKAISFAEKCNVEILSFKDEFMVVHEIPLDNEFISSCILSFSIKRIDKIISAIKLRGYKHVSDVQIKSTNYEGDYKKYFKCVFVVNVLMGSRKTNIHVIKNTSGFVFNGDRITNELFYFAALFKKSTSFLLSFCIKSTKIIFAILFVLVIFYLTSQNSVH